jgi:hypothetical protein
MNIRIVIAVSGLKLPVQIDPAAGRPYRQAERLGKDQP